ncbi:hypothetical protein [Nakamurella lactea]|uniref:hypothetical protein n=1 Tax=Nakamurella lactea TaxID=459515 RepID=UPI00048F9447|nr:hypothetical protein [Nakamurella lactea]
MALLAIVPTVAMASPASASAVRLTTEMHVIGFDASVATTHGYQLIFDARGKAVASVPRTGVGPRNVIEGSCGESYLWITPTGQPLVGQVATGFSVVDATVEWDWRAYFSDPYGSSTQHWTGGASSGEVDRYFAYGEGGHGTVHGQVATTSFAILADGRICSSGGPSDDQYL